MRVTKLIREYVQREVSKKFQPSIDSAYDEWRKFEKEYDEACAALKDEFVEKRQAIIDKFGAKADYWPDYKPNLHLSVRNHPLQTSCREAARKIEVERDKAIEQVLLDLELGATTKADLAAAIAAIQV